MVAIIDYDAGNIKSVEKAVQSLGMDVCVTRKAEEILSADHVILPGVGAFGEAMENIKKYDLKNVIKAVADKNIPFLGICLGQQLLFESSEESIGVEGLGILKGRVKKIPENSALKVPNVGWNSLNIMNNGRLFKGINENAFVYFVHSYYCAAEDRNVVKAVIDYGVTVDASVESGNVFATQFHPEKSSDTGLKILDNFLQVR
ncbi:glutamine amidotransferase [Lachnospiraceae bacterium KH1T2]|nr:glutamine amidotransferase [Lachnospiraceae bacterium KH1T2]